MIAGIVLAAGRSSRLGRPKQLLPVHGEPLIRHTLRRVLASSLDQVILVVGHEADEVRDAVADLPVECVVNPDAAAGQSTSVRAGLAALSPEVEAAVFILGDQPGIDPTVIDALIAAWRTSGVPGRRPSLRGPDGQPGPVRPARSSRSLPHSRVTPGRVRSSAPITTLANCTWSQSPDKPHPTSTPKPTTPRSSPLCRPKNRRPFPLSLRTGRVPATGGGRGEGRSGQR